MKNKTLKYPEETGKKHEIRFASVEKLFKLKSIKSWFLSIKKETYPNYKYKVTDY